MTLFLIWALLAPPQSSLEKGCAALADFKPAEALQLLELAKSQGPYSHADHVKLYEQIGIANAYLDRKAEAARAFDMLLALDPGHALSYTISPKATFLFEQARKRAASQPVAEIDLDWPRDLKTTDPIPIDVEVVTDPKQLLQQATLHTRQKGKADYTLTDLELPRQGEYKRIQLPPAFPDLPGSGVLQLYLTARDSKGNQTLILGDPDRPREIPLAYIEPVPWYSKWWVWALVGGVVAAGTGTAVWFLLDEPPDQVGGHFSTP